MLIKMLNLGKSPKKINVLKEIAKFIEDDFGSHKFEPTFKLGDFSRIKDAVDKGIKEEKILKITEEGDEDEQDTKLAQISQHFEQLRQMVPTNLSIDLFGVDEKEPSDFEKSKFIRKVRVLENPNHVLELMLAGQLTGTEMDALNEFYPEYAQALKSAILEQIAELQGKEEMTLSRKKNGILSTVLGVARITPESLAMFQRNLVPEEVADVESLSMDTEAGQTDVQQTLTR